MENTHIPLSAKIEAILFFRAEEMSVSDISEVLESSPEEVRAGLAELERVLSDRGIRLVFVADTAGEIERVSLVTAPEAASIIEQVRKKEHAKDLSRPALETLSIVLYRGPVTKAEIDHIRGVNSGTILRTLSIRGLIEKIPNPKFDRTYLYRPTADLLSHLGVSRAEDLPEYEQQNEVFQKIEQEKSVTEDGEE